MYIGQPALSRQIVDLEKQFGSTLFIRNNRSVALTPAGEILQKEAIRLIERIDEIARRMEYANKGKNGVLKLATIGHVSKNISNASHETIASMPLTEFSIMQGEQEEIRELLIAGEIDLALTFDFSVRFSGEIEVAKIEREKFILLIPKDNPLAYAEKITKEMLREETMIVLHTEAQPIFFNMIFSVNRIMKNDKIKMARDTHALILYSDAGIGISILPEFVAKALTNYSFAVREIDDLNTEEDIVIAWNKNHKNPAVMEFVDKFTNSALEHAKK